MCYYREDPRAVKNFRRLVSFIILSVLALSCDAPHLNPLDPSNPNSRYGQLTGVVTNSSSQPLFEVSVVWKNQNIISKTDSNGRYNLSNIEIKDGWLLFYKNDYQQDSIYVQWKNQKSVSIGAKQLYTSIGVLDGNVYTNTTPSAPIADVQVIWNNQNILKTTDGTGYFKFDGLTMNDGYIYFVKNGYYKDSSFIQWNKQTEVNTQKYLNFSQGSIKGFVYSLARVPIPNVTVTINNKGIVTKTNSAGYYQIDNMPHANDTLWFHASGYSDTTAVVNWSPNSRDVNGVNAYLNANPQLKELLIYSSIENSYTVPTNNLYIQAKVSDEDVGDIDSVYVQCANLGMNDLPLAYNFLSGYFQTILNDGTATLPSIEDAVGQTFNIIVRDKEGRFFNVGSSFLTRIIKSQIAIKSPANGEAVQKNPTLYWNKFNPGFNFTYMVQVFTIAAVPQLVWQKSNISQNDIQVTVDKNLTSGQNYYWVIWCSDKYHNQSSSKPATFVVQ